jgi:hypothetical protein
MNIENLRKVVKTLATSLLIIFSVFSWLRADATVAGGFSLEIKEWLILEIDPGAQKMASRGNDNTSLMAEITSGRPVEIRALVSIEREKTAVLRSTVLANVENALEESQVEWVGQGDIRGQGQMRLNQETVLAIWQGPGIRKGSIVFYESERDVNRTWKAIFTLSSL